MPTTKCTTCGRQFVDPADWFAHLESCNPARQKEVISAMRGLDMAARVAEQQKETPR